MPPNFQREGIDACKEIRKRHPGTGVVILSQYDDPDYAISLLSRGRRRLRLPVEGPHRRGRPAGPGHPGGGDRRLDARPRDRRRARAPGAGLERPVPARRQPAVDGRRGQADQGHRRRPAARRRPRWPTTSSACSSTWPRACPTATTWPCAACAGCYDAIVEREEQGETLSRLLPGGVAERLLRGGTHLGETESLEVTVLMSDIRGYSTIAERADPAALALQLNTHRGRDEPCHPGRGRHRDAVRGRRRDGRVRCSDAERGPRRPLPGRRAGHARRAGRRQRGVER